MNLTTGLLCCFTIWPHWKQKSPLACLFLFSPQTEIFFSLLTSLFCMSKACLSGSDSSSTSLSSLPHPGVILVLNKNCGPWTARSCLTRQKALQPHMFRSLKLDLIYFLWQPCSRFISLGWDYRVSMEPNTSSSQFSSESASFLLRFLAPTFLKD